MRPPNGGSAASKQMQEGLGVVRDVQNQAAPAVSRRPLQPGRLKWSCSTELHAGLKTAQVVRDRRSAHYGPQRRSIQKQLVD